MADNEELRNVSGFREIDGKEYMYYAGDIMNIMKPYTDNDVIIVALTTYAISLLLGLLGNGICICIMLSDEKNRGIRHFLVSLALADIIFLSMSVPMKFIVVFFHTWHLGPIICKLEPCIEFMACAATVFNMVAVTLERFVVIVTPLKAKKYCSSSTSKRTALLVWILSAVCSLPAGLFKKADEIGLYNGDVYTTMTICVYYESVQIAYLWYRLALLFIAPTTILLVCYIAVIWVLTKSNERHLAMIHHRVAEKRIRQMFLKSGGTFLTIKDKLHSVSEGRKQVIRMLIVIVVAFWIGWGPKLILSAVNGQAGEAAISSNHATVMNFKFVASVLPYVHSCLNPVIYCLMSKSFRSSSRKAAAKYCSWMVPRHITDDWKTISTPPSASPNCGDLSRSASTWQ